MSERVAFLGGSDMLNVSLSTNKGKKLREVPENKQVICIMNRVVTL